MENAKPVVLTKPVRGREMLTKKGAVEHEKADKKKVETYYEGYVDGQLFLVPDSNLEAMKDMINFKMRPKTSVRYKHQTSYDIQYYDQFTEKLNELLTKIDDFQESGDFERAKSITDETTKDSSEESNNTSKKEAQPIVEDEEKIEKASVNKVKSVESTKSKIEVESEIIEHLKKEYVEEESSSSSLSSPRNSKESEKELKSQIVENVTDELRIRFLVSGHFKDGENPMYIVQEYDGKNDIFKDQKLDFMSSRSNNNTNVFISGKLYNENILIEAEGNNLFLNTKPEKIIIDKGNSKIYNGSFEHLFEKEGYSISLQGKSITGKSEQITPQLSVSVAQKPKPSNHEGVN